MKLLVVLVSTLVTFGHSSSSVFDLDQTWTTQDGEKIKLADLKGNPIVTTMTFTSCPGACPLMVSDMKNFDEKLTPGERKNARYILFSFDPKRDTPEALRKFAKKMKLDERWTLLTGNAENARELSAALGFAYKDLGDGDFTHSSTLYLLTENGELKARKERSHDWNDFLKVIRTK